MLRPQSKLPTSSTPTHGPSGPVVSITSPRCAGQRQVKAGTFDRLQHVPSSSGSTDNIEETDISIVQHSGQATAISTPFLGCVEVLGMRGQQQHVTSGSATENEEIVITAILATNVALGLRRLPTGFYVMLHHNGLVWRTETKPSLVNNNIVEWSGPIPISSNSRAIVRLEVYASFGFQPIAGTGEQLRRLTATVGQLLDRSGRGSAFSFFPRDGDVASPCSSVLVTVKRQKRENSDPSRPRVVGLHRSAPEPQKELEDATDQGHSALTRYRQHGEKRDLERSIQQFERALNVCPRDDPRRAVAQSNLTMAKSIFSQAEGTDVPAVRPAGHPDQPLTSIHLASAHSVQFQKGKNRVNEADAEGLLQEATEISVTESDEKQAAAVVLDPRAAHKGGRVQSDSRSSMGQGSTPSLTDENPWILSAWLLRRFGQLGDLTDLQRAIKILDGVVKSTPNWDGNYRVALENLGTALLYRYQHLGQLHDLEAAVSAQKDAVQLTPDGHPDKPLYLNNLGASFRTRFERLGRLSDLEEAISRTRDAIHLIPDHHPDKDLLLSSLSASLAMRFSRLGQLNDIEDAISRMKEAVYLTPDRHPEKPMRLNNLATSFRIRFEHLGQLSDLEGAISWLREAVHLCPDGHPDKPMNLDNLGASLLTRFLYHGQRDLKDIEEAISAQRDAVKLSPDGHTHKPGYLNNLGISLRTCFSRLGQLSNLEDAILTQMEAIRLTPDGHHEKPVYLYNLATSFQTRFLRLGQVSDLENTISRMRETVHLIPDGHPDKPRHLCGLSMGLRNRFLRLGRLSDLEDAISALREAVRLSPDSHPHKPVQLNHLGTSFRIRFEHLGQPSDLEDAISTQRKAVHLAPNGHPDKPMLLNDLGSSLAIHFWHFGQLSDLEDAISRTRDAIDLTPNGQSHKPGYLYSLGNSFRTRFLRLGQLSDLEDAISRIKDAVHLSPDDHPDKPMYLDNLGTSFALRFLRLGQLSDIEDAVSRAMDAVHLAPHDHPRKPAYLTSLAGCFAIRYHYLGQFSDIERALSLCSHVASIPIGPPSVRLSAAQHWIRFAGLIRHPSLLHAYSFAVSLIPQLAWIGLPLSDRLDKLTESAHMVREAAAAALNAGFPGTALEWLEQGRSIIWGDLFQLRSSYEQLSSAHPQHASRLRALSVQLDQASAAHEQSLSTLSEQSQSGAHHTADSLRQMADRHRALAIERDKLLQEIRRLPGFEKFLLRKPFMQLRAAAHSGPVVIVNAAETRCDALIIVAGVDHVIHVPLPGFTSGRCANLQVILKGFVRDIRVGRIARRENVSWDHILLPLWECIVKPVLDALAFSVVPEDLSRIFWCPTGPLAFLPIHAAGLYGQCSEPGNKVFDFVVSSYVPSLAALIPPPNTTEIPSGNLRLLLVRQPPSDGHAKLPGVAVELRRINDVINKSPLACTMFEPSDGTVEEVLDLMKQADWVHFACHGIQDGVDSGLCLANKRRLKLRDIVALSRPRGGLAFLSACQTAKGDQHLSDEAIHIAAGMLFAGYGGVVGTMWSISDDVAPDVAKDVYEGLLGKGPRADYREAARALHEATKDLRRRGKSFDEWVPFIHVGL